MTMAVIRTIYATNT